MGFKHWATSSLVALDLLSGAFARTLAVPLPDVTIDGHDYSEVAQLAAKLRDHGPEEPPLFEPQTYSVNNTNTKRAGSGTRVMIVGDSMTQGREGDWTWRYRMWQWSQANNLGWDFVGPYTGTRDPPATGPPQPPPLYGVDRPKGPIIASGGYATGVDPAFDSEHFAVWGRALTQDVFEIHDVVAAHPPDIMLVMLGFNDLGWFYADADGLFRNLGKFLSYARAAKPDIKFVIANVPQRTSLGREDLPRETTKYNNLLSDGIAGLSTAESPCFLVHLQENYNCGLDSCPVGYDGLHPNALGEYQIAQAFTNTLVKDMKIGNAPISIPGNVPTRPVPVPTNFQVHTSPQGWTATWNPVYGSYGYNVRTRISGFDWVMGHTDEYRYDSHWSLRNYTYEVQIQTSGGNFAGDWTAVATVIAMPQTADAPQNAKVSSSGTSLTVTWDPASGPNSGSVSQYDLLWWDLSRPCSIISGGAFKSSPAVITDLVPGHLYFVAMSTWNANGEGFPSILRSVVIGGGSPGAPTGLSIVANDATTAHMTWNPVPGAAGYRLWTRNVNNASSVSTPNKGSWPGPCADDNLLFPGVWNYEFCVDAYNGDQIGPKGNCVTAPHPTSGVKASTCVNVPRQQTGCGWGSLPTFSDPPTTTKPGHTSTPTHDHPDPTTTTTPKKPYQTLTCDDPHVLNASANNVDLSNYWDDLDCTDAWIDVEVAWEHDAPHTSSYQFTQEMAHTFGQTAPQWNCQNLTFAGGNTAYCKTPISCDDVTSPAAWFIMNSIVGLEGMIASVASTLTINSQESSELASTLVADFGNVDDGKVSAILSIVSIGIGVLGTPMFGDIIKELNNARENLGNAVAAEKDAVTNLVGQTSGIINQGHGNDAFSEQNSLQVNIEKIISTWQSALTAYNTQLFSGSPDQITQILHYIIDGNLFAGNAVPTTTEKTWLDRALYPLLINYLWTLGHAPVFIMDVGEPCNPDKPPKVPLSGNKTETYHCVDGNSYYLASANGSPYVPSGCNPANPHMDCSNADFSEPPGLGKLQPGNQWGGVLPEDFVTGSVRTWIQNGRKNGVDTSSSFASNTVGQIYDLYSNPNSVFQLAGYFNLPVCTADGARSAWKHYHVVGGDKPPTYPCGV